MCVLWGVWGRQEGSVPKYKCPKSYLGPNVSLCTIFLDCISAYFEKRQKFTPGDIPDNSPGQWQGSPTSPLLLLLLPKTQQCPPYSQITAGPHTTLHATSSMFWFIWCGMHLGIVSGLVPGMYCLFIWCMCACVLRLCSLHVSVHLVRWYGVAALAVVWYSGMVWCGTVWLVRLTLRTMGEIRDKPQKEGETPLLAKLSNSQTIASNKLFLTYSLNIFTTMTKYGVQLCDVLQFAVCNVLNAMYYYTKCAKG